MSIAHKTRVDIGLYLRVMLEYERKASGFLLVPKLGNVLEKFCMSNGDTIRYNTKTNEFGMLSKDGIIRTYYKPERGIDYFNEQH